MAERPTIYFETVYPDAERGEYGSREDPSPYTNLAKPKLDGLVNGDELVIHDQLITVKLEYPLSQTHYFPLKSTRGEGFTRRDLAFAISDLYRWVYETEERTALTQVGRHSKYVLNRNTTDGVFGIWGHDLDDLDLHSVEWCPVHGVYILGIDS